MTERDELISMIALTCTPHVGTIIARRLVDEMGSAQAVFDQREKLTELIPDIRPSLVKALNCKPARERALKEVEYAEKNHIRCITINDPEYPSRLRTCDDAPLVLYYLGNTNLNALRVVSVVGTRKITEYGRDLCTAFCRDLAQLCPDVLVVSGLAYGADITAHRGALENGLPTVGVLAHGLDRIYPPAHRQTASRMVSQGGLLTEFMSFTEPERMNFVQRNRIVAGMADATVVVESAAKGGSLITAQMAIDYSRTCCAFPGRVGDMYSQGCNNLIRKDSAVLITSAQDFVETMGWSAATTGSTTDAVQRQLFVELNGEEERIVDILRQHPDGLQINHLVVEADVPINRLSSMLLMLEMKSAVRVLPGACYRALV